MAEKSLPLPSRTNNSLPPIAHVSQLGLPLCDEQLPPPYQSTTVSPKYAFETKYIKANAGESITVKFTVTSKPPLSPDTQHSLTHYHGYIATRRFQVLHDAIKFHEVRVSDTGFYTIKCTNAAGLEGEETIELEVFKKKFSALFKKTATKKPSTTNESMAADSVDAENQFLNEMPVLSSVEVHVHPNSRSNREVREDLNFRSNREAREYSNSRSNHEARECTNSRSSHEACEYSNSRSNHESIKDNAANHQSNEPETLVDLQMETIRTLPTTLAEEDIIVELSPEQDEIEEPATETLEYSEEEYIEDQDAAIKYKESMQLLLPFKFLSIIFLWSIPCFVGIIKFLRKAIRDSEAGMKHSARKNYRIAQGFMGAWITCSVLGIVTIILIVVLAIVL